jgi:hypothetical protein
VIAVARITSSAKTGRDRLDLKLQGIVYISIIYND